MRARQISTSTLMGWRLLLDADTRLQVKRRMGDGMFAVPDMPGHRKRFRPYPTTRRYKRR